MGRKLWVSLAVALSLLVLLGVAGVIALDRFGVTLSWGGTSRSLLLALGVPDSATDVSSVDEIGPDGPMPEIATRSFTVRGSADGLRSDFLERCKKEGLEPAEQDMVKVEPDSLCGGRSDTREIEVVLQPSCADETCRVVLEVRAY